MLRPKANFSDNDFVEGLKLGDDLVLKALYKKYYNLVLKLVVSNSGSSEAAQDIYQETIIVLQSMLINIFPIFTDESRHK